MDETQRLIRETYFVSQRYKSQQEQKREEAKLSSWLMNNTHCFDYIGAGAVTYNSGRLMGENGSLCDIVISDNYLSDQDDVTPRYVLIKVISSPASKDLPGELVHVFSERKYEERPADLRLRGSDGTPQPRLSLPRFFA